MPGNPVSSPMGYVFCHPTKHNRTVISLPKISVPLVSGPMFRSGYGRAGQNRLKLEQWHILLAAGIFRSDTVPP